MRKQIVLVGLSLLLFAMPVQAEETPIVPGAFPEEVAYGTVIDSGNANDAGTARWTAYDTNADTKADLVVISGSGEATKSYESYFDENYAPGITKVIIENGITKIADEIFYQYKDLASVSIPNSVTSIGNDAFSYCTSLSSVSIPNSVTSIGEGAFYCCTSLSSVSIPNSVTSIGNDAFGGCTSLRSVSISNSVTSIGDSAFRGCTSLSSVSIPNSVTSMGEGAFSGCTSLRSVSIPNSVTSIGNHAFEECTSLSSVSIPNSITSIGGCAFRGCTSLSSVSIPNSVTSIGNETFHDCPLLKTAGPKGGGYNIEFDNCKTMSISGCDSLISVTVPNTVEDLNLGDCTNIPSIIIPNNVKSINFSGCASLSSVNIPNSVTSIGNDAFRSCTSLSSVSIPNSVTSIGNDAFYDCVSLSSVSIPNSVTSIGNNAFEVCASLSSVSIPNSVTNIGDEVFKLCTNLSEITIAPSVESFGTNIFAECINLSAISGYSGSEAEKYAARYSIPFRSLGTSCTITFDDSNEGGSVYPKKVKYPVGQKYERFPQVNTSSDYTFIGWFTAKSGGTQVKVNSIVPAGDHTLYARWIKSEIPFRDVPYDAYYYQPVKWAYTKNITTGVSETEFGPNNSCTRGQVVTFLWRAVGTPEPTVTSCPFTDVSAGKYFYKPVLWAVEKGVTTGTSPTTFSPNGTVSRGQVVTFMWRAYGMPSAPATGKFVDVPANAYYAKAVDWAVANGITTGTSADKFSPNGDCIRGQIVTFLYRGYAK